MTNRAPLAALARLGAGGLCLWWLRHRRRRYELISAAPWDTMDRLGLALTARYLLQGVAVGMGHGGGRRLRLTVEAVHAASMAAGMALPRSHRAAAAGALALAGGVIAADIVSGAARSAGRPPTAARSGVTYQ